MTALSVIEQQAVETAAPREVLTCRLGAEAYAIDILAVQEIRRQEPATRIANAKADALKVQKLEDKKKSKRKRNRKRKKTK